MSHGVEFYPIEFYFLFIIYIYIYSILKFYFIINDKALLILTFII